MGEGNSEDVIGLKNKNKELLDKLHKMKGTLSMFDDVDVKALQKDQKTLQKMLKQQEEEKGEYKKLYAKQREDHAQAIDKLKQERTEAQNAVKSLQKQTALSTALIKAKVEPVMLEAAEKLLFNDIGLTDDGNAVVGDKPVEEFVKDWAITDIGKRFVTPPNSGGGAAGSGSSGSKDVDYFDKKSNAYSLTEQAKIAKKNPELYNKLHKQFK